jgi:hypothetical protein
MTPLYWVVFALLGVCSLLIISLLAEMDRAERFRQFGGELPTISSLPRNINKPTALRREVGRI